MSLQQRHRDDYDYSRGRSRGVSFPARHRARTSPRYPDDGDSDTYEHTMNPTAQRRNSRVRKAWENLEDGWRGAIGAITGKYRARSADYYWRDQRSKRHASFSPRSRSRNRIRDDDHEILRQAVTSAVVAGAVEAFRVRNEPGPWNGERGIRVATAALSAAGIDRVIDTDPGRKTKRHVVEAAVGGLVANRLANGPRDKLRH